MHGGAVTLARRFMEASPSPDCLLASDMLDLAVFKALTLRETAHLPALMYCHENQITYPWSEADPDRTLKRDRHYGFINYTSALAADGVLFNSAYHRRAFHDGLVDMLRAFPDHNELGTVERLEARSDVLPVGCDLGRLDGHRADAPNQAPLILWNHRWEHDKNPEDFFRALFALQDRGLDFQVAVLGEAFPDRPPIFDAARARLGERVIHFGYCADAADYARWLWRADILPVTSNQDFFGVSAVEAIYCGCYPLLPDRFAFGDHLPGSARPRHLYRDFEGLLQGLETALREYADVDCRSLRAHVMKYRWENIIERYDKLLVNAVQTKKSELDPGCADDSSKKHPCPDCRQCQWCSDAKCKFCKGWLVKKKAGDQER